MQDRNLYSLSIYLKHILFIFLAVVVRIISVSGEILIGSNNVEATVGENVTLNCTSTLNIVVPNIEWHHFPVGQFHEVVYKNGYIYREYRGRYNAISVSASIHYCNLIINNVTLNDAGRFMCMEAEDEKSQRETELIVFARYPSDGFCRIEYQPQYFVELSCEMEYRGNIDPSMYWTDNDGNVTNSTKNTVAGITTSTLRLTKDQIRNNYSCHIQYKEDEFVSRYKWLYSYAMINQSSTSSSIEEPENQSPKAKTSVVVVLVCLLVLSAIIAAITIWMRQRKRNQKNQADESELTALKEKKVIVVGLSEDGKNITKEMFEFNLHRPDEMTFLKSVPTEMMIDAAAVTYEDRLFVIGIGKRCNDIWKYEKKSGWKKCANLKQGRQQHCVSIVDSSLYICSGHHSSTCQVLKCVEKYEPLADECSTVGELVYGVQLSACAAYKGFIYVFGGCLEDYKTTECVQRYNTKDNKCSVFSKPMPSPQQNLRALSWKKSVILLNYRTCYIFDFETKIWREIEQFITEVNYFGLVYDDDKVFVFGGGIKRSGIGIWECRDEIKCVRLEDIFNNKIVKWEKCGRLPKPTLIEVYA